MKKKFYFKFNRPGALVNNEIEFKKQALKHGWTLEEVNEHLRETLKVFQDSDYNFDKRYEKLLEYFKPLEEKTIDSETGMEVLSNEKKVNFIKAVFDSYAIIGKDSAIKMIYNCIYDIKNNN